MKPYQHVCVDPDSGNNVYNDVEPFEVEHQVLCHHCGEPLATQYQILVHIYQELLE